MPLLTPRAHRCSVAPWVALVLVVLLTAGCASAPPPARPQRDTFRDAFLTSNGLLGVPELWKALGRSTTAALLRHLAHAEAGRNSVWQLSPRATFDALRAETDAVEAAGLIAEAGLDRHGLWTDNDLHDWWRAATEAGDIDHQAVIARLAQQPRRLPVDSGAIDAWRALLGGPDVVPAHLAGELLAVFEPGTAAAEQRPDSINFRHPRDAATYVRQAAVTGHRSPDLLDPEILAIARRAAAIDDWAMYHLARAYAAVGQQQAAGAVVDAMDPRRLLSDGGVLEVPLFEGTVGSTFRMVRTLAAQGRLDEITTDVRQSLVQRTRSLLSRDVSHRVAGLALITLLEPGTVPPADAERAVADALRAAGVSGVATSPEQAIGWTSVAEYADVLRVRLDFPGITARAVTDWVAAKDALAAVSISRFLLALDLSDQLRPGALVDRLTARVRTGLTRPSRVESLALFSGALAVHAATGRWPVSVEQLRAQAAARDGNCLGGFDGFVRDLPTVGVACNTDATWFAIVMAKELDR